MSGQATNSPVAMESNGHPKLALPQWQAKKWRNFVRGGVFKLDWERDY
jgi:hypothetical protein